MPTHYIALIHKEKESGYGVSFPDVVGVTAVPDTLDQAIQEASVTLGFAFEDWQGPLPIPRSLADLRADPAFREWSLDAVVAAVAPAPKLANAA